MRLGTGGMSFPPRMKQKQLYQHPLGDQTDSPMLCQPLLPEKSPGLLSNRLGVCYQIVLHPRPLEQMGLGGPSEGPAGPQTGPGWRPRPPGVDAPLCQESGADTVAFAVAVAGRVRPRLDAAPLPPPL